MKALVTFIFVDHTRLVLPMSEAWIMCGDRRVAGRIMDALMEDKRMQQKFRQRIDRDWEE